MFITLTTILQLITTNAVYPSDETGLYEKYFDAVDMSGKKIEYKLSIKPQHQLWLVFQEGYPQVLDFYTDKIINSDKPIKEYERFLNSLKVKKVKSDIYTVYKFAISALKLAKVTDESVYNYLLTMTWGFRDYPRAKINSIPGIKYPSVIVTFYQPQNNGTTVLLNNAIIYDSQNDVFSVIIGEEYKINSKSFPEKYELLGLDNPELKITVKQPKITAEDKDMRAEIEKLCIKPGYCIADVLSTTDEQRTNNLVKIKNILLKNGLKEDTSASEIRRLNILAAIPNSPASLEAYLAEFPKYKGPESWYIIYYVDGITLVAKLMNTYGQDKTLKAIHRVEELVGTSIGLDLDNLILVEAYLKDPTLVEDNLKFLKSKGMKLDYYYSEQTGKYQNLNKENLVHIVSSSKLKETIALIETTNPSIQLFGDGDYTKKDGGVLVLDPIIINTNHNGVFGIMSFLLESEDNRTLVEKYPFILKTVSYIGVNYKFAQLVEQLAKLKQKGLLDDYYKTVDKILSKYPNILKNADDMMDLAVYIEQGHIKSTSLTDSFFAYLTSVDTKRMNINEFVKLNNDYTSPSTVKPVEEPKTRKEIRMQALSKQYGISIEELNKDPKNAERLDDIMSIQRDKININQDFKVEAKKIFDILSKHNMDDLEKKYSEITGVDQTFIGLLGNNYSSDNLDANLNFLEDSYGRLVEIYKAINNGTKLGFRYKNLSKEYLSKFLDLSEKEIQGLNKGILDLYKNSVKLGGEENVVKAALALIDKKIDPKQKQNERKDKKDLDERMSLIDFINTNLFIKDKHNPPSNETCKEAIGKEVDELIKMANNDILTVKKFAENLFKIGIRLYEIDDIGPLSSLFGKEDVAKIANDGDFMESLKARLQTGTIGLCSWGTLDSLYKNPSLRKYLKPKSTLVYEITQNLKNKPAMDRKYQDGFITSKFTTQFTKVENLSLLDLVSISVTLDYLDNEDNKKIITKALVRDYFDRRTEYGGLFMVQNNKPTLALDYNSFDASTYISEAGDGGYVCSSDFRQKERDAINTFHFHSVYKENSNEDLSLYSGPSGLDILNQGDLGIAVHKAQNGLVFTLTGIIEDINKDANKITIVYHVAWYGDGDPNNFVIVMPKGVDLGIYRVELTLDEFEQIRKNAPSVR